MAESAAAVNRDLLAPYLAAAFPDQPPAVEFGFDFTKPPTPKEVFEVAALAKQAGWSIDREQLEEQTGYTLVKDEAAAEKVGQESRSSYSGLPFMNKEPGPAASAPADATLAAFAKDTTPAAKAIQALLQNPSKEAAEKLLKDLPSLIPDDPALAAVIAEEMAKAFGPVANKREYKRERDGKFSEVDHPRDFKPGKNPDSSETQAAEIGKGKQAIEKCLSEQVDVMNAISRGDIGLISLIYKTPGEGESARGMVRFLQRRDAREHLAETLVRGEAVGPYQDGQKLNLKLGGYVATLRLTSDAKEGLPRNWVLTGYGPEDKTNGGH